MKKPTGLSEKADKKLNPTGRGEWLKSELEAKLVEMQSLREEEDLNSEVGEA